MQKRTYILILILIGMCLLSIKAGNKYNVDPADYESTVIPAAPATEEVSEEKVSSESAQSTAPLITFDSNYVTVEEGSQYDLTVGMTIQDDKDSQADLMLNMDVYGNPYFDIDTPGVYEITYEVTDSDGETTTATRTFEVVPINGNDE